ncbi:MAG: aminotransferase class I/II-fold pyridoxal phosphate-dependent enzyme [Alphaproteobacteria bacterium]|nr:aminotransferase class I/II-fold pyridoxal phosphate-dependent enzyme [Alphaproteobacteria bacterium]
MKPALRSAIDPFIALEVLKAANDRAAQGLDVLHMEVGEPGGGPPEAVLDAARRCLAAGRIGYTESLGIPPLRARIAGHYRDRYGIDLAPERVVVTTGSSAGFLLAFLAAFEPRARIALADPGYPAYRNILKALDFQPVNLAAGPETGFQPTPALLDGAGALAGVLVASPANPTGAMLAPAELEALCAWCRERDAWLISDEIYHGIVYGKPVETALRFSDHAIVVNSFSKYFAMTGWRVGWLVLPEALVRPVERLAQSLYISPPALSQQAALAALDCRPELDRRVAAYARNRALLLEALPRAGFEIAAPADGAFYIYADIRRLSNDSVAFCKKMLAETGVAATPGVDFDTARGHRYVRFSFAGAEDEIARAAQALRRWLG